MSNESGLWASGWAFYKSENNPEYLLPEMEECNEWIGGFCAAMADYDIEPFREYQTIQEALHGQGVSGDLLESCLTSAESIFNGDEWCRFPSVPVRTQ